MNDEEFAGSTAEALSAAMEMLKGLEPMLEMIDAYKNDLARRGYSETAQEAMAMDLHRMMLQGVFTSNS